MKAKLPLVLQIGKWCDEAHPDSGFEVNSGSESGNLLPERRLFN